MWLLLGLPSPAPRQLHINYHRHPLESPLLLSSSLMHQAPLAILHFFLSCRPSPLLLESDILLWQSASLFSPNPSFKNITHPRDLSRKKMAPLKRSSDKPENNCLLQTSLPPCLTPWSLFLGHTLPASLYFFPIPLVNFQFLSGCFLVYNRIDPYFQLNCIYPHFPYNEVKIDFYG